MSYYSQDQGHQTIVRRPLDPYDGHLRDLISARSRNSPMHHDLALLDSSAKSHRVFSPSSYATRKGGNEGRDSFCTERSDSPSLYSRSGTSPMIGGDGLGWTGGLDRSVSSGRKHPFAVDTVTLDDPDERIGLAFHRRPSNDLSRSTTSSAAARHQQEDDEEAMLSPTSSMGSSDLSTEAKMRTDVGPKLRFGEPAPWEMDDTDFDMSRTTHLAGSPRLDSPAFDDVSTAFSAASSLAPLRTRSRSATATATTVLRGLGGLMKKDKADAADSWAALGLGRTSKPEDLRKQVSSETMVTAEGAREGKSQGQGQGGGLQVAPSLRTHSPPPSGRALSTYSSSSTGTAGNNSHSRRSTLVSPDVSPLLPPSSRHPHPRGPARDASANSSSDANDDLFKNPYPSPTSDGSSGGARGVPAAVLGLISLSEAQARQRDRIDRRSPSPAAAAQLYGEGGLPSPRPTPAKANDGGRLRASPSDSSITESSSSGSLPVPPPVPVKDASSRSSRSRRNSLKLDASPVLDLASAPPLPTLTPTKSVKGKKSVGTLMNKMFSHSSRQASSSLTKAPPSPLPSTALPVSPSRFTRALSGISTDSSSASPPVQGDRTSALLDGPAGQTFRSPTRTGTLGRLASGASSASRKQRSVMPSPPRASFGGSPSDSLTLTLPNLKLRPISMAFSSNIPKDYLSSSPSPPLPTGAPTVFTLDPSLRALAPPTHSSSTIPSPSGAVDTPDTFGASAGPRRRSSYFALDSATSTSSGSISSCPSASLVDSLLSAEVPISVVEKDALIRALQEQLLNQRKMWRIQVAEYESQIRDLTESLAARASSPSTTPSCTSCARSLPLPTTLSLSLPSATLLSSTSFASLGPSLTSAPGSPASPAQTNSPTSDDASTGTGGYTHQSVINRGRVRTAGGARGVFGSGSAREREL